MAKYSDLFQGNLLLDVTPRGERRVIRVHEKATDKAKPAIERHATNGYHLSDALKIALKEPYIHAQIAHKFPWAVILIDKKGHRRRKKFCFLASAILYHAQIVKKYPTATVVSMCRGYNVTAQYRGRMPKPWKWCPFCMKPRKYKAALDPQGNRQTFQAQVKTWNETKQHYEWPERTLLLMECPICGQRNNHHMFRRANQPWERIKIPKGRSRYRRKRKR